MHIRTFINLDYSYGLFTLRFIWLNNIQQLPVLSYTPISYIPIGQGLFPIAISKYLSRERSCMFNKQ